jgi:hypothetical protein
MGQYGIVIAPFPFTPLDKEAFHIVAVLCCYRFDCVRTVFPEPVELVPDIEIAPPGKVGQVPGTVHVLEVVPVRDDLHGWAERLYPG